MSKAEENGVIETTMSFTFRGGSMKRDFGEMLRDAYRIFGNYTAEIGVAAGNDGPKLSLRGLLSEKHDVAVGLAHFKAGLDGGRYVVREEKAADEPAGGK